VRAQKEPGGGRKARHKQHNGGEIEWVWGGSNSRRGQRKASQKDWGRAEKRVNNRETAGVCKKSAKNSRGQWDARKKEEGLGRGRKGELLVWWSSEELPGNPKKELEEMGGPSVAGREEKSA